MDPAQVESLLGKMISGRYKIVRLLGEGGMGCVYEAEQQLGTTIRKVAVKTLHPHLSRDPKIQARFMREVGTVAELHHPNTIQVFDFGTTEDGQLYIAMEFVEGRSVAKILETEGPMSPARVENILHQICGSLEEAHGQGIVHRDLKPENVILCDKAGKKDWVEVLDFGIAKRQNESDPNEQKLTQQGMVLGTPPYMSPEQFTGRPIDVRSDIYALGMMTYEMLTGRLPFEANTAWEWATLHMTVAPRPIDSAPNAALIPEGMRHAVMRALAKDPADRFATVTDLMIAISAGASAAPQPIGTARTDAVKSQPPPVRQSTGTEVVEPLDVSSLSIGVSAPVGGGAPQAPAPPYGQPHPQPYAQSPQAYAPPPYPAQAAPAQRQSGGGGRVILLGLVGVVGVMSIVAGVFALKGSGRKDVDLASATSATPTVAPPAATSQAPTSGSHTDDLPGLNNAGQKHTGKDSVRLGANTNPTAPATTSATNTTPPPASITAPPATTTAPPATTEAPPPPPPPPPAKDCTPPPYLKGARERMLYINRCHAGG